MQQGCFFFHCACATSMTNWIKIFMDIFILLSENAGLWQIPKMSIQCFYKSQLQVSTLTSMVALFHFHRHLSRPDFIKVILGDADIDPSVIRRDVLHQVRAIFVAGDWFAVLLPCDFRRRVSHTWATECQWWTVGQIHRRFGIVGNAYRRLIYEQIIQCVWFLIAR